MYSLLKYLPRRRLSQLVGRLVYLPLPSFFAKPIISAFARINRVELSEVARPIEAFRSIGEFFIRDLKPECRPIGGGIVSPVDGTITGLGRIEKDSILQLKGKPFTLSALFCGDENWRIFEDGFYITTYLSPRDYHHIHSPLSGSVSESILIPGDLWPVNSWSIRSIDGLFTINERLIVMLDTSCGPVAVVMIGATNVGAIAPTFDQICTNRAPLPTPITPVVNRYAPQIPVKSGQRLATFRLGSTVLLLFPKGVFQPQKGCKEGTVRYGETLGVCS